MTIPRIIHQTWKNSDIPFDVFHRDWVESWRRYHAAWQHRFWTDADLRDLIAKDYPWFLAVFDGYRHPIQRVDAARYFMLHKHGGLYVDLDVECFKPVDDLLAGCSAAFQHGPVNITNAIMASCPEHWLWPEVFQLLAARGRSDDVIFSTGPKLLTDCLASLRGDPRWDCSVHVFEYGKFFFPYSPQDSTYSAEHRHMSAARFGDDVYGAHRFAGTWVPKPFLRRLRSQCQRLYTSWQHRVRRLVFRLGMDPWILVRSFCTRRRAASGRAFLVVGAERSGTRMLTRFLLHGGCAGDDGHRQRWDWFNPPRTESLVVWRRSFPHSGLREPNVPRMSKLLATLGYEVTIVEIRRALAYTALSQSKSKLMAKDFTDGCQRVTAGRAALDRLAARCSDRFVHVSYEKFVADPDYRSALAQQLRIAFHDVENYSNRNQRYDRELATLGHGASAEPCGQ